MRENPFSLIATTVPFGSQHLQSFARRGYARASVTRDAVICHYYTVVSPPRLGSLKPNGVFTSSRLRCRSDDERLSHREREALRMVAHGWTVPQIATRLALT